MTPRARPLRARASLAGLLALVAIGALAACTPTTGNPTQPATTAAATPPAATAPAATAPAATPAATELPSAPAPDATVAIEVRDFELDPETVSISGSTIGLDVTNTGPTVHNVAVRDDAGVLLASRDLREGESETVVGAIAPGTYVLFCSLAGHESLGIKGTLTVTAP